MDTGWETDIALTLVKLSIVNRNTTTQFQKQRKGKLWTGDALAWFRIPGVWMRGHDGRASLPFSPWYLHVLKTCRAAAPIRPGEGSHRGHEKVQIRCG